MEQDALDRRRTIVRHPLVTFAVEFSPLVAFFVANRFGGIFPATAIFVVATVLAVAATVALTWSVSLLLLFNATMVAVFGGLTLTLHDALFIKIKPTIDYGMFAGVLMFGLATDRLFLKNALGMIFPELGDHGWRVLTRNWAIFFVGMAVTNEIVWRTAGAATWVVFRVWVPPVVTLVYGALHLPYLLAVGAEAASSGVSRGDPSSDRRL